MRRVAPLKETTVLARVEGEDPSQKVRRFSHFDYAVRSWHRERHVVARIEAGPQGTDSHFVVTNIQGTSRWLYETVYCARGQPAPTPVSASSVSIKYRLNASGSLGTLVW